MATSIDFANMTQKELEEAVHKLNHDLPLLLKLAEKVGSIGSDSKVKSLFFGSGIELSIPEYKLAKKMCIDNYARLGQHLLKQKPKSNRIKKEFNGAMGFNMPRVIGDTTIGFLRDANTDLGMYPNGEGVEVPLRDHISAIRDNTGVINTPILRTLYRIYAHRHNLNANASRNIGLPADKVNRQFFGADDQMMTWFDDTLFKVVRQRDEENFASAKKQFVDGQPKPKAVELRTRQMNAAIAKYNKLPTDKRGEAPSHDLNDYFLASDYAHLFTPAEFKAYHFDILAASDTKSKDELAPEIAAVIEKPEGDEKKCIDHYNLLCYEAAKKYKADVAAGVQPEERDFVVIAHEAVEAMTGVQMDDAELTATYPKLQNRSALDMEYSFVRHICTQLANPDQAAPAKAATVKRPVLPLKSLMRSPSAADRRAQLQARSAGASTSTSNGVASVPSGSTRRRINSPR